MLLQIFRNFLFRSIFFTTLLFFLCLSVSGQKIAATQGCKEAAYNCQIAKISNEIQSNPNNAQVFYERGIIYSALKNFDEAMKDFDRSININPKFDKPYSGRGYI